MHVLMNSQVTINDVNNQKTIIGVFGSSAGELNTNLAISERLGQVLGKLKDQIIVITGGCAGLPYLVAKAAANSGVEVWGFSAHPDYDSHVLAMPDDDHSIYTKLVYVPESFPFSTVSRARMKYRNVISTATCDAGIIISGRWGTMNEFTNLVDFQKVVGVLTGTGGFADELPALSQKISKEGQGKIIFNDDPEKLIKVLLSELGSAKVA